MKTLKIAMVILSVVLYSCKGGFSTGVKKDLSTGLTTSYNGFTVDDVYLTVDDNKISSNKISLGKQILVVANGVGNYEEKNGKVFPGCSIELTDKNGKSILNLADAFADLKDGFEPEKAGLLNATISTGNPMVVGETYHLKTRFYDKEKPTSIITSEVDLIMTE